MTHIPERKVAKTWTVYQYWDKGPPIIIGRVQAENAPDALLKAFRLWPDQLDRALPQAGLSVRRDDRW